MMSLRVDAHRKETGAPQMDAGARTQLQRPGRSKDANEASYEHADDAQFATAVLGNLRRAFTPGSALACHLQVRHSLYNLEISPRILQFPRCYFGGDSQ